MSNTLFDKVWDAHVVKKINNGPDVLFIDRHLVHEVTSPVAFLGLKNRAVVFQGIPEKYGSLKIEDDEANALQEKLALLMYREELFKNPNLKLIDVAKRMNVSQHKLSQFLNDNLGTSFSSFINQKRIDKAIKILGENNRITLEAVGYESGFSTKSVFYSTFKKVTGKTPSSFRKETS